MISALLATLISLTPVTARVPERATVETAPQRNEIVRTTTRRSNVSDDITVRPSTRTIRARAEKRANARRTALQDRSAAVNRRGLQFQMDYSDKWTAREVNQTVQFTDRKNANMKRVLILSFDGAPLGALSTETPYLPAFEGIAPLIADYTDLNTVSVLTEKLQRSIPSHQELTDAYVENLAFFDHDPIVCDCDKQLGGEKTTLAYSYPTEDTILVQTWTIIGDTVYLFTMVSDFEHYGAMYADLMQMIGSFRVR